MRLQRSSVLVPALGACGWLLSPPSAHAELDSCGGVFVSSDASCEWREKEECKTECTTERVETACVARIYRDCESHCVATSSTSCESSCSETCTTDCEEAETVSCTDLCKADCQDTCTDNGTGQVHACCLHNCEARCERKCEGVPDVSEPAECSETCTTACSGSCTAQANESCQVECQTEVYEDCQTELVTTCETKCEDDGGAIFCDGQFLNAASADDCAAELKDKVDIDVDVRGVASDVADVAEEGAEKTKKKTKQLCSVHAAGLGGGSAASGLLLLSMTALSIARARRRGRAPRE